MQLYVDAREQVLHIYGLPSTSSDAFIRQGVLPKNDMFLLPLLIDALPPKLAHPLNVDPPVACSRTMQEKTIWARYSQYPICLYVLTLTT